MRRTVTALVLGAATMAGPARGQPQNCAGLWDTAKATMHYACNATRIAPNAMCYAADPLEIVPRIGGFGGPGSTVEVPRRDFAMTGRDDGFGGVGFSFLKLTTEGVDSAGQFTPAVQQVVMIGFGESNVYEIAGSGTENRQVAAPPCAGEYTSTQPTFLRAAPGAFGAGIYEVRRFDPVEIIAVSPDRQSLLVGVDRTATGWLPAADVVLFSDRCPGGMQALPYVDANFVTDVLGTPNRTTRAARLRLTNRPPGDYGDYNELSCTLAGLPPAGLLILNPSGQLLVTTVNDIDIIMASSVLVTQFGDLFSVVVLEGRVTVRSRRGGSQVAGAGETIFVRGTQPPQVMRGGESDVEQGDWCGALTELVAVAFGDQGGYRISRDRLDFCRAAARNGAGRYPIDLDAMYDPVVLNRVLDRVTPGTDRPTEAFIPGAGDRRFPVVDQPTRDPIEPRSDVLR